MIRHLLYQPAGGHKPSEPELNVSPEEAYFVPPSGDLDEPASGMGVPLHQFGGYLVNPARMNGEDLNPNTLQTMRRAYDDGVQLYNGVDGITEKRFGPGQFYVLSDLYPNQRFTVPSGHQPSQMLTASDIQNGPTGFASGQQATPGVPGGPVFAGGVLKNPGGC
jgi:hypothetical protein